MNPLRKRIWGAIPWVFGLMLLLAVLPAQAQPVLEPGQRLAFDEADGGGSQCRVNRTELSCLLPRFLITEADPSTNDVRARFDQVVIAASAGQPNYAVAFVFNEFTLAGSPNNFINTRFTVEYDYRGSIFAAAAYKGAVRLFLNISDVTNSVTPVASFQLVEQARDGDQGFTDVAAGSDIEDLPAESASFELMLRRGRDYRISFEIQVLAELLLAGEIRARGRANWNNLSISVDEDEVELLEAHDQGLTAHDLDIKDAIELHDADLKTALAQHDAEIKALLHDIDDDLEEIKDLLLTPPGRRPGFPNGLGPDLPPSLVLDGSILFVDDTGQ